MIKRNSGSRPPDRWLIWTQIIHDTVAEELIDWGKKLPGGNAEMVKLLRLCVDHGEEKILAVKHSLPSGIIPTVDIIRTHLHKPAETNLIHMSNDIEVADPDLVRFDKKFLGELMDELKQQTIGFYSKLLKLPTFKHCNEIIQHLDDDAGYADFLIELMKNEYDTRQAATRQRHIKATHFPYLKTPYSPASLDFFHLRKTTS